MNEPASLVLFSGGLDSTTALHWALKRFGSVVALIVDYGQTHRVEVDLARTTAMAMGIPHQQVNLPLGGIVVSPLIGDQDEGIPDSLADSRDDRGMPHTYVPFRNGIFLSLAAAYAESRGIRHLVTGFNRIDTPDYPDTTTDFAARMESAINTGTSAFRSGDPFQIHLPLVAMTKREIVELGISLGVDYSHSVSCYRMGEVPCGHCPACEVRMDAFAALGMEDPLITRLKKEGLYELATGG